MSILWKAPSLLRFFYIWAGYLAITRKSISHKKLKEPSNIDELCHFIGLIGYYRKFSPLFADVTKPLNKLLKKDTKFHWSLQCQAVFNILSKHFVRNSSSSILVQKSHTHCLLIQIVMHIPESSPRQLKVLRIWGL